MFFIATASYNYGRFLGDAIESVRLQGQQGVRHHVQDALSTDETPETLAAHGWPGLAAVRERDGGLCDALNRAFANVPDNVPYLGWLNADEFYLPRAFDTVRKVFDQNPSVDVVYGDSLHVDETGKLLRLVAQHRLSATVLQSMRHLYIQTSSTFFRRRVWEAGDLGLDQRYRQAMDQELFVRLNYAGFRFAHVPTPLSCFRVHDLQLTAKHGAAIADEEFRAVEAQFGYRARPWAGRGLHRALKVANGAYVRERRAVRHRGRSLRWFDGAEAARVSEELVRLGQKEVA
jgi:glycosyltransferase involved in cell wall biosynthesis